MNCDITYEELAGLAAGDLEAGREAQIRRHVEQCPRCRQRLAALERTDATLASLPPLRPSAAALLAARRAVAEVIRPTANPEIMTLEEVAEFLRLTPPELGQVVEELPAFELAGQVRVRRERLIEWIRHREKDYTRQTNESWVAKSTAIRLGKGVA
jgi:anti-sigma factor RsiW